MRKDYRTSSVAVPGNFDAIVDAESGGSNSKKEE